MGMFDHIRCEAALPDGFDASQELFQTKSLPDPWLTVYTITAEGRLIDKAGHDLEPDGYISFYTVDESAEDRRREYRAHFSNGQLQEIVRVHGQDPERYYGLASFRWFAGPGGL